MGGVTARKYGTGWMADFSVGGRRVRKHGFPTKSAALRFERESRERNVQTGRYLDDRLSDLIQVWYELHGQTLKDHKPG